MLLAVVFFSPSTRAQNRKQGIEPPILPKELARLDRVEWVLRRTSVAEVAARLKKQKEEYESEGIEHGGRPAGATKQDGASGSWGNINTGKGQGGEAEDPKNVGGGPLPDKDTAAVAVAPSAPSSSPSKTVVAISDAAAAAAAALAPPESGDTGGNTEQGVTPSVPKTSAAGAHQNQADADGTAEEEEDGGEEDDVADRLAGIFEFLRSGNSLLLPPDLRADWESRPDLGLGLLSADDHQDDLVRRYHARSLSSRPATAAGAIGSSPAPAGGEEVQQARTASNDKISSSGEDGGSSYNFTASGGSGKGVSTWVRCLCKEARSGDGEPMTYHDLRMALSATAPRGRRSETTNDKLERRLVERRNRADEMASALWGNNRPGLAENLYARSLEISSSSDNKSPGSVGGVF